MAPTTTAARRRSAYRRLASANPTLLWPAWPGPLAQERLVLLQQLEESQWWTPAELQAQQLRQAAALIDHARQYMPVWGPRLAAAGLAKAQPLTAEDWTRLPVLTREELQRGGADYFAPVVPKGHGEVRETATSGSTGRPVKVRTSRIAKRMWDVLTLREHLWQGRDFTAKLASIRALPAGLADYPAGARADFWSSMVAQIFGSGPAVALQVGSRTDEQAEWLQREAPDYLLIYPTALRELLIYWRDRGLRQPGLRQVRCVSEPVDPDLRQLCREVWSVEIADTYSSQENGYLAFQCREQGAYHLQSEAALVEVLDETGRPCAPGEVGRVVVTSLHNFAMPLLRYEVGDLAEVGTPCPCSRGLPVIRRILGRSRDMLVFPDGRRAWAQLGTSQYTRIPGLRQFQTVQHAVDDLEIRLVADRELTSEEEEQLRRTMQQKCGHPFPIRITYHAEIPRSPGGKFHDFLCKIPD